MTQPDIVVVPDSATLAQRAADRFVEHVDAAPPDHMVTMALSGGKTPRCLYQALASDAYRDRVPWDRTQVFFSDERFVPPDSPESNYRSAQETLLSHVPIPERFVHPVPTVDMQPDEAAALYEQGIRRVFEVGTTEAPRFDFILLGMGPDGHTASLFPGTEALDEQERLVVPNFVPRLDSWRITFTYPLINAARCVVFLVEGADKARVLAQVLAGEDLPAARVQPEGSLTWLIDQAAAADLPRT